MVGRDYKNTSTNERFSFKELLIVGAEFVCAMACVPCVIAVVGLIVNLGA